MRKHFVEVPLPLPAGPATRLAHALAAMVLSPLYLALAWLRGAPGIGMHLRIAGVGAAMLARGRASLRTAAGYMLFPMDSTRYFEFEQAWTSAMARPFTRCLDVSSPRFLPLLLMRSSPHATVELCNPDPQDLAQTRALAGAMGLQARCGFFGGVVEKAPWPAASFDLVTCISVLEHIPQDTQALRTMWSLLQPGGRLILTLPCMAQPMEQYISHNQYGVLAPGDDGYTFWQRFYDPQRLQACIFAVTGPPQRMAVYGETARGLFFRNATAKRLLGSAYPFWREPWMMATEYRAFDAIDQLPGDGVVLLEFTKPPDT